MLSHFGMSDANQTDDLELPAKSGGSKLVLIVALVNLIATAAVAAKVMTMGSAKAAPSPTAAAPSDKPGPIHAFEPFVVNLNEPAGGRFLKAVLEVEMANKDAVKALTEAVRPVRDDLLSYLSNLRVKDTMGEPAKKKIKTEIVARLHKQIGDDKVKRVFLAQFVVQ